MLFNDRNKKGLHKVTANVLSLTLASVMAAGGGRRGGILRAGLCCGGFSDRKCKGGDIGLFKRNPVSGQ